MKAILLIDHGSVREEANHMLACMANLVQHVVGAGTLVRFAHMELAAPSIGEGFAACVRDGASEVVAFPYMLSPGKHSTRDIPRLVSEAAAAHPHVRYSVTPAFGVHEKLAEIVAERAGVEIARPITGADACRCWDPDGSGTACGAACTLATSLPPATR
jgi:sirohydrochlorin ferrochelatase